MALISPRAPSLVTVVGVRMPRSSMLGEELCPAGLGLLVAHGQVQQMLTPITGDAPTDQQGLLGSVAAQRPAFSGDSTITSGPALGSHPGAEVRRRHLHLVESLGIWPPWRVASAD
jgi:hypothetical protein